MKISRAVVVFDAANLEVESAFWAAILNGKVLKDEKWHSVIDEYGQWRIGVQLNPSHKKPEWPSGVQQQQIHLDLHVENPHESHEEIMNLGATLLQSAKDLSAKEGFQVYADPAGHPFCIGWGHPTEEQLIEFLSKI